MRSILLLLALLIVIASPASAVNLQIGATQTIGQGNVPVQASLGLEQSGVRLWGAYGKNDLISFGGDILHRGSNGLYAGLGAVIDYTPESSFSYDTSDTSVTYRRHDNGRHIGDTHVRRGKSRTVITGDTATVTYDEQFEGSLGVVTGLAQGLLFVENRLVINTYGDISSRVTVGLRF